MKNRLLLRHITLLIGVMFFVSNSLLKAQIIFSASPGNIMIDAEENCVAEIDILPPSLPLGGAFLQPGDIITSSGNEFPDIEYGATNSSTILVTNLEVTIFDVADGMALQIGGSTTNYNILLNPPSLTAQVRLEIEITYNDASGTNSLIITYVIDVTDTSLPIVTAFESGTSNSIPLANDDGDPSTLSIPAEMVDCDGTLSNPDISFGGCGGQDLNTTPSGAPATLDFCAGGSFVRTWTHRPSISNQTITVSQMVTVVPDNEGPDIDMSAFPADVTFDCADDVPAPQTLITSFDCSSPITFASNDVRTDGTCVNNFEIARTYTLTDACGNTSVATQAITVNDNVAPSFANPIDAPANGLYQCNGSDTSADLFTAWVNSGANANVSDNCPGGLIMTATFNGVDITNDPASVLTPCAAGAYDVEFTFTDECNGSVSGTATYTIVDGNAPEVGDATDVTADCGDDLSATIDAFLIDVGNSNVSDVCSAIPDTAFVINNIEYDYQTEAVAARNAILAEIDAQSSTCTGNEYARVNVMFQFTDACGNMSTSDADVIVEDNEPPIWTDMPDDLTLECDGGGNNAEVGSWIFANTDQTPFMGVSGSATDCSDVTYMTDFSGLSDLCGETGEALVTFTAEDACGNMSTAQATITIADTTSPTLDDPAMDMIVECDGSGNSTEYNTWLSNLGGAMATDACSNVTWSNQVISLDNPCGLNTSNTATTVAFTATDDCGNTTLTTAIFTIDDTTPPTITQPAANELVTCDGMGNMTELNAWLDNQGNAIATDICGNITWSNNYGGVNILSDGCGATGAVDVTFTATDDCGNTAQTTATFTIFDNVAPVIDPMASDMTSQCQGVNNTSALDAWLASNGGAAATDACSDITWTNDFTSIADPCGTGVTVTFTATDDCNNTAQTTATFTLVDTTPPDISACSNMNLNFTDECTGQYMPNVTGLDWNDNNIDRLENCATDNCGNVTVTSDYPGTFTPASGCQNTGELEVVYTITDDCNQSVTISGVYTIEDNISPTIMPTASALVIQCDNTANANNSELQLWLNTQGGAMAQDNCSLANWTQYEWTATDGDGVVTSGTYTYGTPTGDQLIAPDNDCGWSALVTFVVADECNNTSSVDALVSIEDTTDPTFDTFPADITVNGGISCMADTMPSNTGFPIISDNCAQLLDNSYNDVVINGSCDGEFTVQRTWMVSDGCNMISRIQIITVDDTTPPALVFTPSMVNDMTVECDDIPTYMVEGQDNCSMNVTVTLDSTSTRGSNPAMCDFYNYEITRTWTATDDCDNMTTYTQVVTVEDTTAPTGSGQLDTIRVQCDGDPRLTPVTTANALEAMGVMIEDNCAADQFLTITHIDVPVNSGMTCPTTISRLYSVSDPCMATTGTGVTFTQILITNDTIAPTLTPASDLTYDCTTASFNSADAAFQDWIDNNGGATVTDNCTATGDLMWFAFNSNTNSQPASLPANTCPANRMQMVDFIAEDMCGNRDTTMAMFSVIDEAPPIFETCGDDITLSTDLGNCSADYDLPIPIVQDGCSDIVTCDATQTASIFSSNPGSTGVLVNDVVLSFTVNPTPTTATGAVRLILDFSNIDGEFDAANGIQSEFFLAFGENDANGNPFSFGAVGITQSQCGSVSDTLTIPADVFNLWAADGIVNITLEVNDPGIGNEEQGVNDICPAGSSVTGTLDYNCQTPPSGFNVSYVLSGATNFPATGSGFVFSAAPPLNVGTTTVTYYAEDCAGNVDSCKYEIIVEDNEAPILDCSALASIPNPVPAPLCSPQDVVLPRPFMVIDNCAVDSFSMELTTGMGGQASASFSEHPNIDGYVMNPVNMQFTGMIPPQATDFATIEIFFKGDLDGNVDSPNNPAIDDEILQVFGDNGVFLANASGSSADCGTDFDLITTITVPYDTIAAWSVDGIINLSVVPVSTMLTGSGNDGDWNNDDYGINPCPNPDPAILFPNSSATPITDDNRTMLRVRISFPNPVITYCVTGATDIAETPFPAMGGDATVTLEPGANTVTYKVTDAAGNTGMCSEVITVGDTSIVAPILQLVNMPDCPNDIVEIIDIQDYEANMDTLNNPVWSWFCDLDGDGMQSVGDSLVGTTDVPSLFLQVASGDNDYYAFVTDASCFSGISNLLTVSVDNFITKPEIIAAPTTICVGDEFGLFIQNSAVEWDIYEWTGSNGYSFDGPFPPVITDATSVATNNGLLTYILEVTSTQGCTARDTVFVEVLPTPETPNLATNSPVCNNESIVLETSAVCDSYQWIGPNGTSTSTLADYNSTTTTPMTTIFATSDGYASGMWTVICMSDNGCSVESAPVEVIVNDPLNITASSNSPVCEGEDIQLSVNTVQGATYEWGYFDSPISFVTISTQQNPVITNAALADARTYTVIATDADGCTSTSSVTVEINRKPVIGSIFMNPDITCVDGNTDITLTPIVDAETAPANYTYSWTSDNGFTSTSANVVIPNATSADNGSYVLVVTSSDGCVSDAVTRVIDLIDTPANPVLSVNSNELCEGDDLVLMTDAYSGSNVTYEWFDSNGSLGTTSNVPSFTVPNTTTDESSNYSVIVTVDGCVSNVSGEVVVTVNMNPATPTLPEMITVCEGDQISLQPNEPQIAGAVYNWVGSNGFTSSVYNPTIFPASMSDEASYTVQIDFNGCISDVSDPVLVTVSDAPNVPIIISDDVVCIDDPSATFILSVDPSTATPGATYEWFYLDAGSMMGIPMGTSGLATTFDATSFAFSSSSITTGSFEFYVQATIGSCTTPPSVPVTVQFSAAPTKPEISASSMSVCPGQDFELFLLNNSSEWITYSWTGSNGYTANTPTPPVIMGVDNNTNVNDTLTYILVVENSLGCTASDTVMVEVVPTAVTIDMITVDPIANTCVNGDDDITLTPTIDGGADLGNYTYSWTGPNGLTSTNGILVLPNGTSADNGSYTLVATSLDGCVSDPLTVVVDVRDAPATPTLNVTSTGLCEGDDLTLTTQGYTGNTVGYAWFRNNVLVGSTNVPSLTITDVDVTDSGNYTVIVGVDGCSSNTSQSIPVIVGETPNTPVISGPISVCAGEVLQMEVVTPIQGATYSWTGPNNFTSSVFNPTIFPATISSEGSYNVQITVNGCTSEISAPLNVSVFDSPATPTITNNGPICVDDPSAVLTLSVDVSTATPGASYEWFNAATDMSIGTSGSSTNFNVPNLASYGTGMAEFYVIASLGSCEATASIPTAASLNAAPLRPLISASPNTVCAGEDFGLFIDNDSNDWVNFTWTGSDGYTFNGEMPPAITGATTTASTNETLTYMLTVENAAGCTSTASITVEVFAVPDTPVLVTNSPLCDNDALVLSTSNVCDSYQWIGPRGDAASILATYNSTTNAGFTTIPSNSAAYDEGIWTVTCFTADGCSATSEPVEVVISAPIVFEAGNDGPACEGDDVQLTASDVENGSYQWIAPGFSSMQQNPVLDNVTLDQAGQYVVVVTDANGCTALEITQVQVRARPVITAVSVSMQACVTGLDDITLNPTVDDGDGQVGDTGAPYSYSWTSANGFTSTNEVAVLPNGTSADNGSYVLIVTSANGCSSDPFTVVVDVRDQPVTPALMVSSSEICEGDDLTLTTQGYTGSTVTYEWFNGGTSLATSSVPSLTITNVTGSSAGNYSVVVTVDGCISNSSQEIPVSVNPIPTAPTVTTMSGQNVFCEGDAIQLQTQAGFIPGASYEWAGPNGFSASIYNPTIPSATLDAAGDYVVVITIDGCPSAESAGFTITIGATPIAPTLINNGPVCIDDAAPILTLSATTGTTTPGATYEWFNAATDNSIGSSGPSPDFNITDFTDYPEGTYEFYVIASVGGCDSEISETTTVVLNGIPDLVADAGDDLNVCDGMSVSLNAETPTEGIGTWTQIGATDINIANPNNANTSITGLVAGNTYSFQWTLSNGSCGDYSFDIVSVVVSAANQTAEAGSAGFACNASSFNLAAEAAIEGNIGTWSQSQIQSQLGITIVDVNDPTTQITGLVAGNTYEFTWTLSNDACGDFDSDVVQVTIENNQLNASAGEDFVACGGGDATILAQPVASCSGMWSSPDPELVFADESSEGTVVMDLKPGLNTLVWTVDCGACGVDTDTLFITYETLASTTPDVATVEFNESIEIDVLANDNLPANFTVDIIDEPTNGSLSLIETGVYGYTHEGTDATPDQFTYQVCSTNCPDVCSNVTTVSIIVAVSEDCTIPTIITPNSDGINDAFVVECLFASGKYPNNQVAIYNQWGDEIFRAMPYENNWEGTYNGEEVPVGTYFYHVDLGDGSDTFTGFLVIER